MRRAYPELRDAGLDLLMVGMGNPEQSAAFARDLDLPYPVLSDPERAAFHAYGLVEAGPRSLLNPASGAAYARALLGGHRGGKPVGDPRQLGGAFVVDRRGVVRLARPSAYPGDHASPEELLAAAAECDTA